MRALFLQSACNVLIGQEDSWGNLSVEAYFAAAMAAEGEEIHLSASFILVQADTFEAAAKGMQQNEVVPARKVSHEFAPAEFLSLFKRFNVTLSSGGELEGREYSFE